MWKFNTWLCSKEIPMIEATHEQMMKEMNEKLEKEKETNMNHVETHNCPHCGSAYTKIYGTYTLIDGTARPRAICKDCKRAFTCGASYPEINKDEIKHKKKAKKIRQNEEIIKYLIDNAKPFISLKDGTDISDLPLALQKELVSIKNCRTKEYGSRIKYIHSALEDGPLTFAEIMIVVYRKHNHILTKKQCYNCLFYMMHRKNKTIHRDKNHLYSLIK